MKKKKKLIKKALAKRELFKGTMWLPDAKSATTVSIVGFTCLFNCFIGLAGAETFGKLDKFLLWKINVWS